MSEVQSLTQTSLDESRKTISNLTKDGLIELIGKEYMLTAKVYEAIKSDIEYTKDKVIQFVKAKNRILDYLEEEEAITNEKIRELCGFTKQQARAVIDKMRLEGILQLVGKGSASKYILASKEWFIEWLSSGKMKKLEKNSRKTRERYKLNFKKESWLVMVSEDDYNKNYSAAT